MYYDLARCDVCIVVHRLLQAHADPNGSGGVSPLHCACCAGNLEAVHQLLSPELSHTIDVMCVASPLGSPSTDIMSPAACAAYFGLVEILLYLVHQDPQLLHFRSSNTEMSALERISVHYHSGIKLSTDVSMLHIRCAAYCWQPPLIDILTEPTDEFLQHVSCRSQQHMLLVTLAQWALRLFDRNLDVDKMEEFGIRFMEKFVWTEPQRTALSSLLQLDELPEPGVFSSQIVATIFTLAVSRLEKLYVSYLESSDFQNWRRQVSSPFKLVEQSMTNH